MPSQPFINGSGSQANLQIHWKVNLCAVRLAIIKEEPANFLIFLSLCSTMASTSLLQSTSSTFSGIKLPCRTSVFLRAGFSSVTVKASAGAAVFVDKAEADNVNRLKTSYLEKIVPLLKEEFSYSNILEV